MFEIIVAAYPELTVSQFIDGTIVLQDDGDGVQYIAKWDYSKPIPDGMKVGK